jgi:hypothetical protein
MGSTIPSILIPSQGRIEGIEVVVPHFDSEDVATINDNKVVAYLGIPFAQPPIG